MQSRRPETGNYRVIGVDTFAHEDWVQGDFETKEEAIAVARAKGGQMTKMHVYGPDGQHVFDAGTF